MAHPFCPPGLDGVTGYFETPPTTFVLLFHQPGGYVDRWSIFRLYKRRRFVQVALAFCTRLLGPLLAIDQPAGSSFGKNEQLVDGFVAKSPPFTENRKPKGCISIRAANVALAASPYQLPVHTAHCRFPHQTSCAAAPCQASSLPPRISAPETGYPFPASSGHRLSHHRPARSASLTLPAVTLT